MPHDDDTEIKRCECCARDITTEAQAGEHFSLEACNDLGLGVLLCESCCTFGERLAVLAANAVWFEVAEVTGSDAQDAGPDELARVWSARERSLEVARRIGHEDARDLAEARRQLAELRDTLFVTREHLARAEGKVARLEQLFAEVAR